VKGKDIMGCQENSRRKGRNERVWEKKTKEGIEEKYYGPSHNPSHRNSRDDIEIVYVHTYRGKLESIESC
jgi:hypothetical protein